MPGLLDYLLNQQQGNGLLAKQPLGGVAAGILSPGAGGASVRPYEPSIRDRVGNFVTDAANRAGLGGQAQRYRTQAQAVSDFLPILGDTIGAQETGQDYGAGNYGRAALGAGATAAGALPLFGPMARGAVKKGIRAVDDLPMDEASRMGRAADMGFDRNMFHETKGHKAENLTAFNLTKEEAGKFDHRTPRGVFTKSSGNSIGIGGKDEVQMPLKVRTGNIKTFRDDHELMRHLAQDEEYNKMAFELGEINRKYQKQFDDIWKSPNLRELSKDGKLDEILKEWTSKEEALSVRMRDNATEQFKRAGIDTVEIKHDSGSMGRSTDTLISLDPKNIRSKFAKFDPAKADSSNILAGTAGLAGIFGLSQADSNNR